MEHHKKVAENVCAELGRKGSKMIDIAGALEISTEALRLKRRGVTPFTVEDLAIIAKRLGIPFTTLIEGAEGYSKGES